MSTTILSSVIGPTHSIHSDIGQVLVNILHDTITAHKIYIKKYLLRTEKYFEDKYTETLQNIISTIIYDSQLSNVSQLPIEQLPIEQLPIEPLRIVSLRIVTLSNVYLEIIWYYCFEFVLILYRERYNSYLITYGDVRLKEELANIIDPKIYEHYIKISIPLMYNNFSWIDCINYQIIREIELYLKSIHNYNITNIHNKDEIQKLINLFKEKILFNFCNIDDYLSILDDTIDLNFSRYPDGSLTKKYLKMNTTLSGRKLRNQFIKYLKQQNLITLNPNKITYSITNTSMGQYYYCYNDNDKLSSFNNFEPCDIDKELVIKIKLI